jgi:sugar (pentulose or hexulose) kinase
MMDKYVLAIDCGTQSIRALIFDQKGTLHVNI